MPDTNYGPAVDAMLGAAGINPTKEERDQLVEMYTGFRPGIQALYEIPEVRYESPALVFQAEPKLAEWGSHEPPEHDHRSRRSAARGRTNQCRFGAGGDRCR